MLTEILYFACLTFFQLFDRLALDNFPFVKFNFREYMKFCQILLSDLKIVIHFDDAKYDKFVSLL